MIKQQNCRHLLSVTSLKEDNTDGISFHIFSSSALDES